jgi:hypothetical protein
MADLTDDDDSEENDAMSFDNTVRRLLSNVKVSWCTVDASPEAP